MIKDSMSKSQKRRINLQQDRPMNAATDDMLIDFLKNPMKFHKGKDHKDSEIEFMVNMAIEIQTLRINNASLRSEIFTICGYVIEVEKLRKEKELLFSALATVKDIDHCNYTSALTHLKETDEELAKEIFLKFNEDWDTIEWEDI